MSEVNKKVIATITIDARNGSKNQAVETRATFFSYDYQVGVFEINLKKDGQALELPEDVEIVISPKKLSGDSQKNIYGATAINHEESIVYWDFPEELRGYVGKIRVFIGVKYADGKQLHGGYFNFSTDVSEIDEELPEFEEIYWQSWEDFKREAEADWETWSAIQKQKQDVFEEETNAQVLSLTKQLAELELQTDELDQKQKDLIAQLADYMTKEQFVRFLAGETIEIIGKCDFAGKVSGSVAKNVHAAFSRIDSVVQPPNGGWNEFSQNAYDKNMYADNDAIIAGNNSNVNIAQMKFEWDLTAQMERDFPGVFSSLGISDLTEKVAFVKSHLSYFEVTNRALGTGATGDKLAQSLWNGSAWIKQNVNNSTSLVSLVSKRSESAWINAGIQPSGKIIVQLQAAATDSVTASTISSDYAQLTYSLRFSLYDFVPAKKDVYDKTQADQRFVSLSQNQTVGGVKNFLERPQLNGTGLLAKGEAQMVKVTNDDGGAILSMDNSKTLARWIAEAGWGVHSCYMAGDVAGGTGFSGRGLIVNNESETQMAGSGYILVNKVSTLDFNNGLMVRHFLPDTASGGIVWTSDWLKCGSTNKTRLTPTYSGVAAGQTIQLSKDIRNFSMLAVNTGSVSDNVNITQMILPWSDGTWRPDADGSMDRWGVLTASGTPVVLVLTSYTTLEVVSTPAGAAGIRYIDGIM